MDGIDHAEILEIIDHHRLGTLETVSAGIFPEPASGLYRDHYVPDVCGEAGGDSERNRGTALRSR